MKIEINNNDPQSIKKAEKKKARLENLGFNLIKTEQYGVNKWILHYKKA